MAENEDKAALVVSVEKLTGGGYVVDMESNGMEEHEAGALLRSVADELGGRKPVHETVAAQATAIARALAIHEPVPARYYGSDLNPSRPYDCAGCGEGRAYPCRTARALEVEA